MENQVVQNQQVNALFEVKAQSADYKSIFATQDLKINTVIANFSYKEKLLAPNRYSVQINETEHISLSPDYLKYLNHSCTPNVFLDTQKMELTTLRAIEAGEELMFFYPSTEWKMTEAFDCICKQPDCLQSIQGAAYLTYDNLIKYRLSEYILDKYRGL